MRMKKAIAIMSAAGLLLSGTPIIPIHSLTSYAAQSNTVSGRVNSTVNWSLDITSGVLTISGKGAMKDFKKAGDQPWRSYKDYIRKVVISEGITRIGSCAFASITSMKNAIIAESVTSIGEKAFDYCIDLQSIVIPKNVNRIEEDAFCFCVGLQEIMFFPKECDISNAFYQCSLNFYGSFFAYPDSTAAAKLKERRIIRENVYNIPDLNADGKINAADAQLQQQIALDELMENDNPKRNRATDFNRDGHITSLEAQFIMTYYLNNSVLENDNLTFYDIVPDGYLGKPGGSIRIDG